MKLAGFNINDINRRLTNLLNWFGQAELDIVCLQELTATDTGFPTERAREAGYHPIWRGENRWDGVAILERWAPVLTRVELPSDAADRQSRYLEAVVNGLLVASIYVPNESPRLGPRFDYKLAWLKRLTTAAAERYVSDYNVVPTDPNIYPTKSWDLDALLQPESRAAHQRLSLVRLDRRHSAAASREPMYAAWDYMRNRWERDDGLRLDHVLLSSALTERPQDAAGDRPTRAVEGASTLGWDGITLWLRMSQMGGEQAYKGHLGKDRSA
jgi:exodeoxyribonuclease-3